MMEDPYQSSEELVYLADNYTTGMSPVSPARIISITGMPPPPASPFLSLFLYSQQQREVLYDAAPPLPSHPSFPCPPAQTIHFPGFARASLKQSMYVSNFTYPSPPDVAAKTFSRLTYVMDLTRCPFFSRTPPPPLFRTITWGEYVHRCQLLKIVKDCQWGDQPLTPCCWHQHLGYKIT
jgi:hypothetical protein